MQDKFYAQQYDACFIFVERESQMSQQHAHFEEEFRDGPQPHNAYQDTYVEQPSATYPAPTPPLRAYAPQPQPQPQQHMNAQIPMLLTPVQNVKPAGTGIGARVFLAIVSMIFVFGMFMVALAMGAGTQDRSLFALAVIFAFVFALVAFLINLIVNLVSLRR
jgi:hypothetical protein